MGCPRRCLGLASSGGSTGGFYQTLLSAQAPSISLEILDLIEPPILTVAHLQVSLGNFWSTTCHQTRHDLEHAVLSGRGLKISRVLCARLLYKNPPLYISGSARGQQCIVINSLEGGQKSQCPMGCPDHKVTPASSHTPLVVAEFAVYKVKILSSSVLMVSFAEYTLLDLLQMDL